ncbi:helix-turn-helix domain-containing protein [Mycobacterium sp. CBMA271]|uniref:Rv2175c family DNA-binding protein n=1 Tax=unclassified Mycobacteroides TaxID=2618759 RepID=UPI0012DDF683|nr:MULTISPECIES: Rv2175c family DNA-binding protein [unclassified Mycobacteroides]MUM18645.1 DNA-binding protein [Mycobacteroides sp. CBMA 326]MUM22607.1 helix-turn-helix domain-containing protein [Mycobacteroides sp. CBMA 271]
MSSIPFVADTLDVDEPLFTLKEVAARLRLPVNKVQQYLRDGELIAVKRDGEIKVPVIFFSVDGPVVKHLFGLLSVLRDGGFHEPEIMRWLFTGDESLTVTRDGTTERIEAARPVDALHGHQAREVLRRAQAMAY